MKKQLQKKHKVMLGVGSGILAATAVAAPLAITLTKKETINPNNMDEVYGVDETAYENMKSDLDNDYLAKLQAEGLTEEAIAKAMAEKDNNVNGINAFVANMHSNGQTDNVYTTATKMLRNYALNELGVDLVRKSRANWNEVQDMFDGMSSSFGTYMDAHFFDEKVKEKILAEATSKYNGIMDEVKTQYANDILGGVMKAKTQLISCFDSVNATIARYAAFVRLNEFITNYSFQYREDAKSLQSVTDEDANRIDVLTSVTGELKVGQPIAVETMNKIFVCYNNETRQPVSFDTDMLPGYKLVPIFKGQKTDGITNTHSIQVDWSAISANYTETNDAVAATAHLIDADAEVLSQISQTDRFNSIEEFFDFTNEHIKLTDYQMLASSNYESNMLQQTYFNNNTNIQLVWGDDACYDGFMYADQDNTETEQTLTLRQLARTNVYITDGNRKALLKDVFKSVDQEGYEPKDMIEKFVANCDVVDTIKLSKGSGNLMNVTNSFAAYYQNQINWKDSLHQKAVGSYTFAKGVPANGYTVSAEFFKDVNDAYNRERKNTTILTDKKYQKLYNDAKPAYYTFFGFIGVSAIYTGVFLAPALGCLIRLMEGDGSALRPLIFWSILFTLAVAALTVTGIKADHYESKFYSPLNGYVKRANDFNAEEGVVKWIKQKITDDSVHFAVMDDDGKIDPQDYQNKLDEYRNMKPAEQKHLFLTYRDFETGYAKYFFDKARAKDVDPIKFQKDFAGWRKDTGSDLKIVALSDIAIWGVINTIYAIADNMPSPKDVQAAGDEAGDSLSAEKTVEKAAENVVKKEIKNF